MGSVFARISGHDANSRAVLSTFLSFLNMKNCLGLMDPPQSWFLWANALRTYGRISLELLMIISSMRQDSLSGMQKQRHIHNPFHPNGDVLHVPIL